MSLDKAIKYGKEKRKPRKLKRFAEKACHNHGRCEWCRGNRLIQRTRKERAAMADLREDVPIAV